MASVWWCQSWLKAGNNVDTTLPCWHYHKFKLEHTVLLIGIDPVVTSWLVIHSPAKVQVGGTNLSDLQDCMAKNWFLGIPPCISPWILKINVHKRYNADFFVASGHPFVPVIRPPKRNSKKVFFWDILIDTVEESWETRMEGLSGLILLGMNKSPLRRLATLSAPKNPRDFPYNSVVNT